MLLLLSGWSLVEIDGWRQVWRSVSVFVIGVMKTKQHTFKHLQTNDILLTAATLLSPSDSCELTVDTNTVNRKIKLSDSNNRKMTCVEEDQSYPDHPDRFNDSPQLPCGSGLSGRCYWEVEWSGEVSISVRYKGIRRRRNSYSCGLEGNDQSWGLKCLGADGYSVWHNDRETEISKGPSSSSSSGRVAVYVDCPAGSLSFYKVFNDKLIHLYTFNTTFTEPLYPGFGFWFRSGSVSLCSV